MLVLAEHLEQLPGDSEEARLLAALTPIGRDFPSKRSRYMIEKSCDSGGDVGEFAFALVLAETDEEIEAGLTTLAVT